MGPAFMTKIYNEEEQPVFARVLFLSLFRTKIYRMPAYLFILIFLLYFSLVFFVFKRSLQALPKIRIIRVFHAAIFLIASVCLIAGIAIPGILPMGVSIICKNIAGCWVFLLTFYAGALMLSDILLFIRRIYPFKHDIIDRYGRMTRSLYPVTVLAAILSVIIYGYLHFINPQVVILDLNIDKQINKNDTLTIVAASDLHLGGISGLKRLSNWVELINSQQPDFILLAGDLIDHDFNYHDSVDYISILRGMHAKYGVYSVLGNHEYYNDPQKAIRLIENSGIRVLRDQTNIVDSTLIIVGRDDGMNTHRKNLESLVTGLNKNYPVILLDHQPIIDVSQEDSIDLQISGHLHNGQIFPCNLMLARWWTIPYGYKIKNSTHVYVTSGLGLRFIPLRLGTQSEIVKLQVIK